MKESHRPEVRSKILIKSSYLDSYLANVDARELNQLSPFKELEAISRNTDVQQRYVEEEHCLAKMLCF